MAEKDLPTSSNATSDTAKLEGVIVMLTLLIKIGKYLPWIVLAFAAVNLTVAVFYFTRWDSMAWGIFNLVLAVGGFVFFAQLVRRRKIHRQDYRYTPKDAHNKTTTADIPHEGKVRAAEAE